MATQEWQGPYLPAGDSTLAIPPPSPSHHRGFELRPLTVGEILDRVFSLYRTHFWLLAGLSAVSAGVSVLAAILRLGVLHFITLKAASPGFVVVTISIAIIQMALYLVAYSLTVAATTSAVNALYLGETTSMPIALRTAKKLWLRCMGIGIWQGWSAAWVCLVLLVPFFLLIAAAPSAAAVLAVVLFLGMAAGFVYGIIAYLRNSLAIPAAVIEDLGVRKSMRRSKSLATGRIGRIFLLILLVYVLWVVAGFIQLPLAFLLIRSQAGERFILQGLTLAVNFIITSLVGPVAAIGLCLFYFDERVRREGFDIDVLLRGAAAPLEPLPPAIAAEPIAEPHTTPEPL